jgi:hypothetical protein
MIRIIHPDFLPIPDPGVEKAPDPGSRIRKTGNMKPLFSQKLAFVVVG